MRVDDAEAVPLSRRPAWREVSTWYGALVFMLGLTAVIWIVQIVNSASDQRLDRFGLRPRRLDGLWGVLTQPFLHSGWGDLLSDTLPLVLIGWVVLITGLREWAIVSGVVLVFGGLGTWLVAPAGLLLNAGGIVFGWLGYLLARAVVARRIRWIITAIMVLAIFGALLGSLAPDYKAHSAWASHLCGFLAGVLAAIILHPHPKKSVNRAKERTA